VLLAQSVCLEGLQNYYAILSKSRNRTHRHLFTLYAEPA
jgi:hypothetical protein